MTLFRDGIVLRTRMPGEADRIMLGCSGGRPPGPRPVGCGGRL
ncbi:hypothetical protein [Streptomyces sp. NBC_00557]|nr:hypothetical protein [Streptomyces sp. NBC_00557]WUC37068.1 hypothetical protein OG956_24080 [Streptomyces sp. NBC_00557]